MNELAKGTRIRLVYTSDPYTALKPGDLGTVYHVDGWSIGVQWDSGSMLGLVPGEDRWEVV